jgi:hypothetical protein
VVQFRVRQIGLKLIQIITYFYLNFPWFLGLTTRNRVNPSCKLLTLLHPPNQVLEVGQEDIKQYFKFNVLIISSTSQQEIKVCSFAFRYQQS